MLKWNEPEGFTMKRSIFLAVFGLTYGVVSSFGQGYVIFSSYIANLGAGAITTYSTGQPVGPNFNADLYYALGSVSDPVSPNWASESSDPTGLTDLNVSTPYFPQAIDLGYFEDETIVTIPGYAGGPITFEVVAFNGSSYANSTLRGRSGSFTMNSITMRVQDPPSLFGDNGQPMPDFIIPTPEPTTLILAALGGLVSLVMFRRKQS